MTITEGFPALRPGVEYEIQVSFGDAILGASELVASSSFVLLHTPRFEELSVLGGEVRATVHNDGDVTCTLHYVVLDASADAPSLGFTTGDNYDTETLASVDDAPVSVSGLSPGDYVFYAYFHSAAQSLNSGIGSSATFTVPHAPNFGTPVVSGAGATIPVTNGATATSYNFFYVVLGIYEAVPSVSDITSGGPRQISVGADATEDVVLSDLSGGAYRLYGFFGSNDGSTSAVVGTDPITILHTPTPGFPTVSGSEVSLRIVNSRPTAYTLHYVVLAASEGVPAPGFDTGDTYDTQEVDQYGTVSVSVPGLSPGSSYIFHAYFSDGTTDSAVISVAFTVLHAPVLSRPVVSGAEVRVDITNGGPTDCVLHYQVQDALAPAPAPGFTTGTAHGTVLAGDSAMVSVPGLSPGRHILHAYFSSVGDSVVVSSAAFTVLHAPALSAPVVSGTEVSLSITNNGPTACDLHYVVQDALAPAPAPGFTTGTAHGTVAAGDSAMVSVPGLSPGSYILHAYFSSVGDSAVVSSTVFTVLHTPRFTDLSVSGEEVHATVHNDGNVTCTVHYVVLVASMDIPSTGFGSADYTATPHLYGSVDVAAGMSEEISVSPMPDAALSSRQFSVHAYFSSADGNSEVSTSETIPILFAPQFGATIGGTGVTPIVSVENTFSNSSDPSALYTFHYLVLDTSEAAPETGFNSGTTYGTMEVAENANFEVSVVGVNNGTYKLHGYFSVGTSNSLVASSVEFVVRRTVAIPIVVSAVILGEDATLEVENPGSSVLALHYVVFAASDPAPSPGFDMGTRYATEDVAAGDTTSLSVTGLTPGDYVLYAYFHSAAQSLDSDIQPFAFTVIHPPRFDTPVVSGRDLDITVHNDGSTDYTLHYQALLSTEAAPSTGFTTGTHYATATVSATEFRNSLPNPSPGQLCSLCIF